MIQLKGIFRYVTFGLRLEWIELFFDIGLEVLVNSHLGPKQKQALYHYLQDAELIKGRKYTTEFYYKIKRLYQNNPLKNSENIWTFIWINLSYNAPLFTWYNTLELAEYTKNDIFNLLSDDYGKKNRGVDGACTSLISTFDRTPIGTNLKIGKVITHGNSRKIIKEGGYSFHPLVILYSLYKFAEHHNTYRIFISQIKESPLSPQKIFVTDTEKIRQAVLSLFEPDFITVDFEGDEIIFSLNSHKTGLDIVDLYLSK